MSAYAQEQENNLKNFRFGLKAAPSINWLKPDDSKKYEKGGSVFKFNYGLALEFRLNNVASLTTGLMVNYAGGKINYKDSSYYFISKDELVAAKDTAGKNPDQYRLLSREYKINYVTLPLTLKMKTKEIGMMTYFGEFGVNTSFRTKARANDELKTRTLSDASQSNLDITDDVNLFNFQLNIGIGAEYNVAGSTSIVFGVNYLNGFSNALKKESRYIQQGIVDNTRLTQKATSKAVILTVGVLF